MPSRSIHRLGIISDTHGLVRPEAVEALRGVEMILHAGDVGGPEVLDALRALAPVVAVRGNVDGGPWARKLPLTESVEVGGTLIYLLHDLGKLDIDLATAGVRVVVFGHSHAPTLREEHGVLFFNPGSAGPRRFHLPVSLGLLDMAKGRVTARHVVLA